MKIVFNGEPREAVQDTTVAALLRDLNFASQRCAVEVNLEVVPRSEHEEFKLHEGDRIEVVTLVGGG